MTRIKMTMAMAVLLSIITLGTPGHSAEGDVSIVSFAPDPSGQGVIQGRSAFVLPHLAFNMGMLYGVEHDSLVLEEGTTVLQRTVGVRNQLELYGAVGLFDVAELSLALPTIVSQWGEPGPDGTPGLDGQALGDLRFGGSLALIQSEYWGAGLALLGSVSAPTGTEGAFVSHGGVGGSVGLAVSKQYESLFFLLDLEYQFVPTTQLMNITTVDRLALVGGARFMAASWCSLGTEVSLSTPAWAPFQDELDQRGEVDGVAMFQVGAVELRVGGGASFLSGWGSPDWRLFFGVSFGTGGASKGRLAPPSSAPLPTMTTDETFTGTEEVLATATNEEEATESEEEAAAEMVDDIDPDSDDDGFCDPDVEGGAWGKYAKVCLGVDQCPAEPEELNDFHDDDGCPDAMAKLVGDQLVVEGTISFALGQSTILPSSYPTLDHIAKLLVKHPEIAKVAIVGHTDSLGDAKYNLTLSKARAYFVRHYLVKKGVAPSRLVYQGKGEDVPLVEPELSLVDQKTNRRVEFEILAWQW